jgi:pSer/pThr/pTyr-binding forkhead associated (FHA) protein
VICTTCGRDNPGQLVFCQECGQRLPRGVAAPTPPLGVPPTAATDARVATSPLAATTVAPSNAPSPSPAPPAAARPAAAATPRPAAPDVNFAPKGDPSKGDPGESATCPHCGSTNQTTVRFCVTCGKPLTQAPAVVIRPKGPAIDLTKTIPTPPPVHDPAPAGAAALAPGRVVEVGSPPAAPPRLCPRCRTPSEGSAQFCRLCGASLADGVASRTAAQPAPAPEPPPVAVVSAAPAPPPAAAVRTVVTPRSSGSPRAAIVLIARDGGEGPSYPLGDATDIGRTEGNILLTDDAYISPRHARITLRGQAYFLRDLESDNGVYVRLPFADVRRSAGLSGEGGEPLHPLKDQDLFLVGQQVLRFEVVKDAEEGFGVASNNGTLLFGSPVAPRYARLVQRTVEGVTRDVFYLRKTETVLGREGGDIVFTDDPFLSRRHAIVRVHVPPREAGADARRPLQYSLADLGSSNGTFLRVQEEVLLRSGDQFRIGQQLFRFDLDPAGVGGVSGVGGANGTNANPGSRPS